jgi:hypothetical protein
MLINVSSGFTVFMFLHPCLLFLQEQGEGEREIKEGNRMIKRVYIAILTFFALLCLMQTMHHPLGVTISEGKSFIFPEIIGWKQSGEIQTFMPKTLYEYIDGAADLYLAYDFEELRVAEYLNDKKASVSVEIYRHKSSIDAFGIYSQERPSDANYLNIGAQGYIDKNISIFLLGSYYVKINSYNTGAEDQEVLQAFTKKVAESLGEEGRLPSTLSSFPLEGKIRNSEKFIARNFLGYSFLKSALTGDYDLAGQKFKLFLIDCGDRNECKNLILKYLEQTKSMERDVTEGRYTLTDPHHGIVDLCWGGNDVWGILDSAEPDLRSRYLKLFEEKIKGKQ